MAVEYVILVGCVALTIYLGFDRFGGEVAAKAQCQAAAVLSLSTEGCSGGDGTGVDFGGVEVSDASGYQGSADAIERRNAPRPFQGSADAVERRNNPPPPPPEEEEEEEEERDCSGLRAISCAGSDFVEAAVDVGSDVADLAVDVTNEGRDLAGNIIDTLSTVDDDIGDGFESFYTGIGSIVTDPLRDLAPLVGLGGDGAPGVGETLGSLLTNNVVTQLATGDFQGAWESTLDGAQGFVGWDDFASGDFNHGAGTLLGNVALTVATFGVGGAYKIGVDQAADAAGTARRSDGDGDDGDGSGGSGGSGGNGGAGGAGGADSSAAVWDDVKPTQPVYDGTVVPRSFELSTDSGDVWVHPNATEHIAERSVSTLNRGGSQEQADLAAQVQIQSLQGAVQRALADGVPQGELVVVDGWELIISPPRGEGQLPAVTHARQLE